MTTDPIALIVQEWERAKLGAQDYIDMMPEDHIGFRPVPEILSFAGQFLHIADANVMFASGAYGTAVPSHGVHSENKPELLSKSAMRAFALASYDTIIDGLKTLKPEALDEEVQFFKFTMPRHLLLAKALEHHAHHRGQTAIYFRLQGIKPPSERLF